MSITTPSDSGDRNWGGNLPPKNKGAIRVTQTQYGVGNNPLALQPHPRPPDGTTAGVAGHAAGAGV